MLPFVPTFPLTQTWEEAMWERHWRGSPREPKRFAATRLSGWVLTRSLQNRSERFDGPDRGVGLLDLESNRITHLLAA